MTAIELTYVLISLTSFLLGVIVGWISSVRLSIENPELRRVIALVLLAAYVISVLAEIQLDEYQTPVLLHAIMGAMVGYLFSQGKGQPFEINIGK